MRNIARFMSRVEVAIDSSTRLRGALSGSGRLEWKAVRLMGQVVLVWPSMLFGTLKERPPLLQRSATVIDNDFRFYNWAFFIRMSSEIVLICFGVYLHCLCGRGLLNLFC